MKKISTLIFFFLALFLQAQEITEKNIKTQISEVTVFIEGAQLFREKETDLIKSVYLLKFTDLSPFIDAKSIQFKANGDLNVLSVNFQKNYLNEEKRSEQMTVLDQKLKNIDDNIRLEKTHLAILNEELAFLKDNRFIGGKNQELMLNNLKATADYYTEKLTAIKLKEIERNEKLEKLTKQRNDLQKQIETLSSDKDYPSGEIWVKIDSKKAQHAYFSIDYLVGNAGWFPSYDVKAQSIDQPLSINYKANVHQDTKVDWTNVKMNFSSSNPKSGSVSPELIPYFLNYDSRPPVYNKKFNTVSGQVISATDNLPVAGAIVFIKGSTIGTISDLDGNYSLSIPANGGVLECRFIGMKTSERTINNPYINFRLESESANLAEYEMADYEKAPMTLQGKAAGIRIRGVSSLNQASALPPPVVVEENQTSFTFALDKTYSLKSDNKTQTVVMQELNIPANFHYFCIPKIDPDAFLIAYLNDWEKLNLLEGEANIFFEDTYIGKSLLDVRNANDTLRISLGRDKNVQVKRENLKEYSEKQFLGNKKEETKSWTIAIKNNKKQAINLTLLDQIPVPTLEEIELNVQNSSGAKYNKESGELKWQLNIEPLQSKQIDIKYSLKYPKNKHLIID